MPDGKDRQPPAHGAPSHSPAAAPGTRPFDVEAQAAGDNHHQAYHHDEADDDDDDFYDRRHSTADAAPLLSTSAARSSDQNKRSSSRNRLSPFTVSDASAHGFSRGQGQHRVPPWIADTALLLIKAVYDRWDSIRPREKRPTKLKSALYLLLRLSIVVLAIAWIPVFVKVLKYYTDADKNPRPWRDFCRDQPLFDHARVDTLAPVSIFVGVLTYDKAGARRQAIRDTWGRSLHPSAGNNVQLMFVMGRPEGEPGERAKVEAELYGDIVFLDIKENMNKGKSYEYFRWASQNATMHVDPARLALHPPTNLSLPDRPSPALLAANGPAISSPFPVRRPDYVVKADDDTFIIPRELERHLRATPRERSYWGYVVKHRFMGGESYALSTDLVDWMAHSQTAARMKVGPEDHRTALMLGKYPGNVTWTNERCWIYDHPQAGTVYSHGFLFPSEVSRIRSLGPDLNLPPEEYARRGGLRFAKTYSTVWHWVYPDIPVDWQIPYTQPRKGMSAREAVEALVEGSDASIREDDKARGAPGGMNETFEERMEHKPYGGTVVVHSVKKPEWFFNSALAFQSGW